MALTPHDVEHAPLRTSLRGYDRGDVEHLRAAVVATLEDQIDLIGRLRVRIGELEAQLAAPNPARTGVNSASAGVVDGMDIPERKPEEDPGQDPGLRIDMEDLTVDPATQVEREPDGEDTVLIPMSQPAGLPGSGDRWPPVLLGDGPSPLPLPPAAWLETARRTDADSAQFTAALDEAAQRRKVLAEHAPLDNP